MARQKKYVKKSDRVVLNGPDPFKVAGITRVDYKDVNFLRQFISERGKIRSRKITNLTIQQQKEVARAIKNAREMALLPYVINQSSRVNARRKTS